MQVKKDQVREDIEAASLRVFARKGYMDTKICDISESAGVSVGNIYRYYKNKEEIFNSVIPECFRTEMQDAVIGKISAAKNGLSAGSAAFQEVTDHFIRFMLENRERITIIFSGSKGTRLEHFEPEIVEALTIAVKHIYPEKYAAYIKKYGNGSMLTLIYQNLIRMYAAVMGSDAGAEEVVSELKQINLYHFSGIMSLLNI